jgi:hypothetical protein
VKAARVLDRRLAEYRFVCHSIYIEIAEKRRAKLEWKQTGTSMRRSTCVDVENSL